MPYVGRDLQRGNYLKLDDITSSFDGSTTTFNLQSGGSAFYPGSAFSIFVVLSGLAQEPESAYTINKNTINFASAPTSADDCFITALGVALGVGVPAHGTVNGSQLAKPFNYDGGLLYLDATNDKIGVANTTPAVELDVNGRLDADYITGIAATFSGNVTIGGTLTYQDVSNIDSVGIITAQAGIHLGIGATSGLMDVATGISTFSKIGIGITNPQKLLDLSAANPTIGVKATGGNDASLELIETGGPAIDFAETGSAGFRIRYDGGDNKFFITSGSDTTTNNRVAILRDSGYFGINQTTPTADLEVAGSVGTGATIFINPPTHNTSVASIAMLKLGYKHSGGQAVGYLKLTEGGGNSFDGDLTVGVPYNKGGGQFGTRDAMTIKYSGNVGIGTDNPTSKLHVANTNTTVWPFASAQSGTYAYTPYPHELIIDNDARGTEGSFAGIYFNAGADTDGSKVSTARISAIDTGSYKADLVFSNRGSGGSDHKENLRIKSDGNIGINEASPDTPLHITGGLPHIRLENSGTSASAGDILGQIDFKHNDSDDAGVTAAIKCTAEDNAGNSYLTFHNGDGGNADERLRITSGGQTLINQTAALDSGVMLGVKNPTSNDTVVDVVCGNNTQGSHIAFSDTDAYARGIISYNHTNNFLSFRTNGVTTDRLHITSAGEVLIGRTSKANDINKLVVTGTSPADNYDSQLFLEGSETSGAVNTGGALAFGGHDGSTARNWANIYGMKENGSGGNVASYMSFHTRPAGGAVTERLRIDSSGNITQGIAGSATFSVINSISANAARGIEIHKDGTDTGSAIKLAGDNGSGTKAWSQLGYSGANGTAHWANYNTAGNKVGEIQIGSTGNIGIGDRTSNPDADLHVHTASGESTIHVEGATNGILNLRSHSGDSTVKFSDASASNVGNINYDHGTDSLSFRVNSAERLSISSTGWQQGHAGYQGVGINTFASWARTGGAIRAEVGYNAVTLDYMYFGTGTTHPLALRTGNTNALFIDNNRRVGIGTDNPGEKLDVEGSLRLRAGGNWTTYATRITSRLDSTHMLSLEAYHNSSTPVEVLGTYADGGGSNMRTVIAANGMKVGIGTDDPDYNLEVIGSFAATTKSFVINHPTKENHQLRYACLEGPENSVYVRGRSSDSVIELPDYWVGLVHDDSITANITPIGNKNVWVESINNNSVTIGSDDSTEYFYTVFAERKDVEKLEVEVEK